MVFHCMCLNLKLLEPFYTSHTFEDAFYKCSVVVDLQFYNCFVNVKAI